MAADGAEKQEAHGALAKNEGERIDTKGDIMAK